MDTTFWLGTTAAICSAVSFAPQAWKIIRTRDTAGISVGMYLITVIGFVLWTAYAWRSAQWPLLASNVFCLVMSSFILAMKLMPQTYKEAVADQLKPDTRNVGVAAARDDRTSQTYPGETR